ncbi:MAG: helix-turn-helix transcriptional regulator, partial [Erysipelotrichaceae bacterium]|nr:helix-turn-helix transcriptional regulator [Erysipelotrichaceae bacterium]
MDMMKIGKNLQELRKEKGMTQEQLAEHFNVARRTVSRWET